MKKLQIKIADITIGGDNIPVQTMIKNPVTDVDLTVDKVNRLAGIGCDIIRISIPDKDSAEALKHVIKNTYIPIVADIHFDYKLAIMSVEAGVHKIRINPGNIGDKAKVQKVIDCVKANNIPVRIGINGGSLPQHLIEKYNNDKIKIMIEAAKEEVHYFENNNYNNLVLSFKSSNVMETIEVNQIASKLFSYPLHIGVTEAGDFFDGAIKNSIGISSLLLGGIGDTIRVSLTAGEEKEIETGKKILEAIGKITPQLEVISCPTCGRTEVNIEQIVAELKNKIKPGRKLKKNIKIAVMGCVVNGPGEARSANFGVACGKDKSVLFKDGIKLNVIKNNRILDEIFNILEDFYEQ